MDTLHAESFLFKPIYLNVSLCFHLLFMASFYLPAAILCSGDIGTPTPGVVKSLCIEEERRALVSFKNERVDHSGRLSSWVGRDCCRWEGISCNNSTGRVVKMNLRNPYPYPFSYSDERWDESAHEQSCLGGKINASLLTLKYLNYLDLSMNNFHGIIPIPNFFGQLNSLQYLNLSSSLFGGEIPYSLGNPSSLNFLDLGFNYNLSSSNLSWVSHLSSLKYLNLEGIDLSSTRVSWAYDINTLPSLLELHLSSCQIKSIPLSLQKINFTSLLILDLSDNKINSAFPSWLFNFTSLKELNLARNNLTSPFLSEFANLKSLESLDLSATGLKGQIPKVIGNLCKLKFLSLRANNFDGGGIEEFWRSFSNCSNNSLESLDLSFCGLQSQLPASLGMLKSLQNLDFCGNHLWGSIPDSIGNLSSLKTLDLSYNYMNGSIPESIGQLTELVSLHLYLNIWEGILTESHFINLTSLQDFQVGDTQRPMSLSFKVAYDWVPPFKLHTIKIINCRVGPDFGVWLRSQTELVNVNLHGNEISKNSIPEEWLSKISTQVVYLILAHNQFSGNLPTHLKFPNSMVIDLSRNNLVGPLPLWSTNVSLLYLQSNSFSGPIPLNIDQLMPNLEGLYLFENHLNGIIPNSICNIQSLEVLALKNNQFSVHGLRGAIYCF
ncbi:hypothetical protein ACFX2I_035815 [Malus domestica]